MPIADDRLIPCDPKAELDCVASILAWMLRKPDTEGTAPGAVAMLAAVGTDAFLDPFNATAYKIALALMASGDPVNASSIGAEAVKRGVKKPSRDYDELIRLPLVGEPANPEHYAQLVLDLAKRRMMIAAADGVHQQAYDVLSRPDEVAARAIETFKEIDKIQPHTRITPLHVLMDNVVASLDKDDRPIVPTGFHALDGIIHGFLGGEVVVVGARTSTGKTAFGLSMALQVVQNTGRAALFMTLEMPERELANRVLSIRSGVSLSRFRSRQFGDRDKEAIAQAAKDSKHLELLIRRPRDRTARSIAAFCTKVARDHDLAMIVIDYLQLMHTGQKVENRQVEVARMSGMVKDLAVDLDVPIVLLAQLNRNPSTRTTPTPHLTDLRESGAVEQDADCVILVHRPYSYYASIGDNAKCKSLHDEHREGETDLIVAKMRNGMVGQCAIWFDGDTAQFTEKGSLEQESRYANVRKVPQEHKRSGVDVSASRTQPADLSRLWKGNGAGAGKTAKAVGGYADSDPPHYASDPQEKEVDDELPF